jgi:RNA polymerase sigma-70 factor (ECF subfamily)
MADTFGHLLLVTMPDVRGYAVALTRCRTAADDLLQEAALNAWQARDQFRPGTNFRGWFCRIMRNAYISGRRRHKPTSDIAVVPEQFLSIAAKQEEKIALGEILRAFSGLPLRHREVLSLICAQNFSYEEAAEAMSCTVGTIKSRLWRAREEMHWRLMGCERSKTSAAVRAGARRRAPPRAQSPEGRTRL